MGVGVLLLHFQWFALQKAIWTIFFITKHKFFNIKKKSKKFFFFQCFSSVSCYVKQVLRSLHLFWEDWFLFLRRALCSTWKKIHGQMIAFSKKAAVKISRISNSKSPIWNPGKCFKNNVLNFFSYNCEWCNFKNTWFLHILHNTH